MEAAPHAELEATDEPTERFLAALLVEDAELYWDPTSGKAHVARHETKPELDSAGASA